MRAAAASAQGVLDRLGGLDWSFAQAERQHPIHGLHPYPAKFVPALPAAVIERLSNPGDLVADPFCGSGTALVEALRQGRLAVGGDLNPVGVVSSRAKTRLLSAEQVQRLHRFADDVDGAVADALARDAVDLPAEWDPLPGQRFKGLRFWFSEDVAYELGALAQICGSERDPDLRAILQGCLSSIVVTVSWQDSDTRYVRRAKDVAAGTAPRLLRRKIHAAADALADLAPRFPAPAEVSEGDARECGYLEPETVSLVITSPPYPNAWSYHLYHQNRILWLGADPWLFKSREIGNHRTYSAANGSDGATFEDDMGACFGALLPALRPDAHVVVVVGDSIVRGELVRNDEVVTRAAEAAGLVRLAAIVRLIDPKRKAFNPKIGKIRSEHVVVFRA